MFKAIKNAISNTDFKLETIIEKINTLYIEDKLSKEQRVELMELARSKAEPRNSYDMQKQLDRIFVRLEALESKLAEKEETVEPTEPDEEYPEFVQPTGAHDCYQIGDKVTFNGKKYTCLIENCVWSPETYPQGWEEVIETTEEVVEGV